MERRNTIQKELVLNAVLNMKRHVTADEVFEVIKAEYLNIGRGTVYRNLAVLVEEGKIRKVDMQNGPDRYDSILQKHYHVQCMCCGELFDVDMDEIQGLEKHIRDTHGIMFLDYDILFKGICPSCQKKQSGEQI